MVPQGINWRWRDLEPAEPVIRHEKDRPGEMIHIDIKKLGKFDRVGHRITGDRHGQSSARGIGWEFVHVCASMTIPAWPSARSLRARERNAPWPF